MHLYIAPVIRIYKIAKKNFTYVHQEQRDLSVLVSSVKN